MGGANNTNDTNSLFVSLAVFVFIRGFSVELRLEPQTPNAKIVFVGEK